MSDRIFNVPLLRTGNAARQVLAEGILCKGGAGRFRSCSAGSQPKRTVNPFALKALAGFGYPVDGHPSKSWDELALSASLKQIGEMDGATRNTAGNGQSS